MLLSRKIVGFEVHETDDSEHAVSVPTWLPGSE